MTAVEQPAAQLAQSGDMHGTLARWLRSDWDQLETEFIANIHLAADLAGRASCGACVEIVDGHNACRESFYVMSGILASILNSKVFEEEARAQKEGRILYAEGQRTRSLPRSVDLWARLCMELRLNGTAHDVSEWLNLHTDLSLVERNTPTVPVLKAYSEV